MLSQLIKLFLIFVLFRRAAVRFVLFRFPHTMSLPCLAYSACPSVRNPVTDSKLTLTSCSISFAKNVIVIMRIEN